MFVAHVTYFLVCCRFLLSKVAFVISFLLVFAHSLPVVVFFWVAFLLPSFLFPQISVMFGKSLIFFKLSWFFDNPNFRVWGHDGEVYVHLIYLFEKRLK